MIRHLRENFVERIFAYYRWMDMLNQRTNAWWLGQIPFCPQTDADGAQSQTLYWHGTSGG